jgi:hypothetical protein
MVPNGLKPVATNVAQHIIVNPFVGTEFYIPIRLHYRGMEGGEATFRQSITI